MTLVEIGIDLIDRVTGVPFALVDNMSLRKTYKWTSDPQQDVTICDIVFLIAIGGGNAPAIGCEPHVSEM